MRRTNTNGKKSFGKRTLRFVGNIKKCLKATGCEDVKTDLSDVQ